MEKFQFEIGITLVLLLLGFIFGRHAEKKHFQSIIKREAELANVLVIASKNLTEQDRKKAGLLVTGSVVISVDYFKRFVAMLRTIFGGRVRSYEALLDRARREAILRMKRLIAILDSSVHDLRLKKIYPPTRRLEKPNRNENFNQNILLYFSLSWNNLCGFTSSS